MNKVYPPNPEICRFVSELNFAMVKKCNFLPSLQAGPTDIHTDIHNQIDRHRIGRYRQGQQIEFVDRYIEVANQINITNMKLKRKNRQRIDRYRIGLQILIANQNNTHRISRCMIQMKKQGDRYRIGSK